MKKNVFKKRKAVVFAIVAVFIAIALTPTISSKSNTTNNDKPMDVIRNNLPILSTEEIELKQKELYRNVDLETGWYWKPSYPNYSPSGMPDFDEKQDQWKAIEPGPNGVLQSQPAGDDIFNPTEICIAPGPNCHLETVPVGDDVAVWAFCGPVAVANCFWWFDSKYADPTGTPGDGKDNFALVADYGAGDDHSAANAPLLIENLARAMQTTSKGTTSINDMQSAIQQWFIDTNLHNMFEENTYNKPTFQFVENEIERSQDVILLIGYYNRMKVVDQQQTQWNQMVDLPHMTGHLQSFTPSVNVLDAVQVLLSGKYQIPTIVKVCIWNQIPNPGLNPLGTSQMTIIPDGPTWYQFHFDPSIALTPGALYYISVDELVTTYNIHWHYYTPDIYAGGMAFWEAQPWVFTPQPDKDFAFKTEYYSNDGAKIGGHFLTCAGVNSQDLKIAVSDPCWDIQNPTNDPTKHNDAQFVSHDIYNVIIGCPVSNYDYKWWLPDFPADCDYTIVEQAVVICPINSPPNKPSKPSGPATGFTGVQYQYTTNATDPDPDDQIKYGWDFNNDGIVEPGHWTGYYTSGATCTVGVTFASPGTYNLSVVAEDNHGAQSAFSSVLTVVISPGTNNPPTVSITSPSSGATVAGTISIQGTASDSDGTVTQVEVRIDSGSWWTASGTTSWTTSWDTTTMSDGPHTIYASSKDNNGAYSTFASVPVTVNNAGNNPPNKPVKPSGQVSGKVNVEYTYTTSTTDSDGDQVYYNWSWGDGTYSGWTGPYASGASESTRHNWTVKGSYSIKVKAKDIYGKESSWSDPLPIRMPYSYSKPIPPFLELLFQRFPHIFPILRHLLGC